MFHETMFMIKSNIVRRCERINITKGKRGRGDQRRVWTRWLERTWKLSGWKKTRLRIGDNGEIGLRS